MALGGREASRVEALDVAPVTAPGPPSAARDDRGRGRGGEALGSTTGDGRKGTRRVRARTTKSKSYRTGEVGTV